MQAGTSTSSYPISANLYGGDLQFGYKQFFGKIRRFGLRYYGMFSGQTGNYHWFQNPSIQNSATPTIGSATNFFYGAGVDALFNFYESDKHPRTFGAFVGAMLGGSSWLLGEGYNNTNCDTFTYDGNRARTCASLNAQSAQKQEDTKTSFAPTFVQFSFNLGFRANFSKHIGVEAGVRVPVIDIPFYKAKNLTNNGDVRGGAGSSESFTFRRDIVFFTNYVHNF